MKLLVLVSCFCLQLASAPAAKAFCPDLGGGSALKAPESAKQESHVSPDISFAELALAEPVPNFLAYPASAFLAFVSFPGSKEFLIRTGLSPPLVIG